MNKKISKVVENFLNKGAEKPFNQDYQKYLLMFGLIMVNGVFVYPQMKKYYAKIFSNSAEITHVVNKKNIEYFN
jgi:hypothetical protein